jgi:hypothetical protein
MADRTMALSELRRRLDARGSNLDDWPDGERDAALALVARSAAARAELDRGRRLEQLLREAPAVPAAPALGSRIRAAVPPPGRAPLADWFAANLWRPALTAALSLGIGFVAGVLQADLAARSLADQQLAAELSALTFSEPFQELPDAD